MKLRIILFTLILAPLVLAQDPVKPRRKAPAAAPLVVAPVEVTKGTIRKTLKLKGAFVPAEASEIKLDF